MFEKYKVVNKVKTSNIFKVIKEINKKYNNSYHSVLKTSPQEIMDGSRPGASSLRGNKYNSIT